MPAAGGTIEPLAVLSKLDRRADRAIVPSWRGHVAARLRSRALDEALIAGADPAVSSLLAARAARLTSRPSRSRLAAGLERLLQSVERPRASGNRVLPRPAVVHEHRCELAGLAEILRGSAPVYARGVAIVRALLSDGAGPLYAESGRLGATLAVAHAALAGEEPQLSRS